METICRSRRHALRQLVTAAAAAAAGCSHVPLAQKTYQAFNTRLPDPDAYPTTPERIAATPYATLGAQFQGQPKVVMTLATAEQGQLNWVSSNHVTLSTREGFVVATRGLPVDLLETEPFRPLPLRTLLPGQTTEAPVQRRQFLTARGAAGREAVDVVSRFRNLGEHDLTLLGAERPVWLFEEVADYATWRWRSINQYWVDRQTRFVWKTRQQFTPELEPLTLEMLKPYA